MIKTMYLSCFRSVRSWFFVVKDATNVELDLKKIESLELDKKNLLVKLVSFLDPLKHNWINLRI